MGSSEQIGACQSEDRSCLEVLRFGFYILLCSASGKERTADCFKFFFFFFNKFIYLFLVVLGLRCCTRAFFSCSERGLLFVAVRGLLIAVASLVAEHRL